MMPPIAAIEPAMREDRDADAVDADARPPRRLGVAADGEDVAAEAGALDHVLHADHEGEQDQHRQRHAAVGVEDRATATIATAATSDDPEHQRRQALAGEPGRHPAPVAEQDRPRRRRRSTIAAKIQPTASE